MWWVALPSGLRLRCLVTVITVHFLVTITILHCLVTVVILHCLVTVVILHCSVTVVIIIMFIDCKWVDTRWQWSFNMLHMHGQLYCIVRLL